MEQAHPVSRVRRRVRILATTAACTLLIVCGFFLHAFTRGMGDGPLAWTSGRLWQLFFSGVLLGAPICAAALVVVVRPGRWLEDWRDALPDWTILLVAFTLGAVCSDAHFWREERAFRREASVYVAAGGRVGMDRHCWPGGTLIFNYPNDFHATD